MSFFNPDIYNEDNLLDEDKEIIANVRYLYDSLTDESCIDEYCDGIFLGKLECTLLKERLSLFLEFLKKRGEAEITDMIVSMIEGYSNETLDEIIRRNTEGIVIEDE